MNKIKSNLYLAVFIIGIVFEEIGYAIEQLGWIIQEWSVQRD